jgi:hypothetical protein
MDGTPAGVEDNRLRIYALSNSTLNASQAFKFREQINGLENLRLCANTHIDALSKAKGSELSEMQMHEQPLAHTLCE